MAFFLSLLPEVWPWLILIAAQILVLSGRLALGFGLLGLFGLVALSVGLINIWASLGIVLGFLAATLLPRLRGITALAGHIALILWSLMLGAHLLPGVHNLLVLDQVRAGPGSGPFTMYLNLDKPMVLFAVLLAWPAMLTPRAAVRAVPLFAGLVLLAILLNLGVWSGTVHPEVGLPSWWLVFALSNLFLTCLTEEAFFRGYLQSAIGVWRGPVAGLVGASTLFGLAHIAGGPVLMAFAALVGLACGLGYYATGRLWVPVLMHFAFNFLHLALFTYPVPG